MKGGSERNYCPTREERIPIIFLLSRARPTQQKTREDGRCIPGRKLMVLVPSAGLTKETWSRSHPAQGWYTTDRHASWKRPVVIRNSSLAPTFQMKPSNFPFPSPELLPGNLPCPQLWSGKIKCAFYQKGRAFLSFMCTLMWWLIQKQSWGLWHVAASSLCLWSFVWNERTPGQGGRPELLVQESNDERIQWPWKPPFWMDFSLWYISRPDIFCAMPSSFPSR